MISQPYPQGLCPDVLRFYPRACLQEKPPSSAALPTPAGLAQDGMGARVGEAHLGFTNDCQLSDGVSRCLWAQKVDLGVRFAPCLFSYLPGQMEGQSRLLGTLPTCWDTSVAFPGAGRAQPVALGSRFRPSSSLRSAEFIHPPLHPGRSGRRGLSFLSDEQVEWSCRVVW